MRKWIVQGGLLLVFLAGPVSAEPTSDVRRYAVIIGNNEGRVGDQPLRYAERDAGQLADILRRLGGLRSEDTVMLLGESAEAIRRAVLEVNARIRSDHGIGAGRSTLIVYFSGHADISGLHPGDSTLPYDELRAVLRGSAATVRLLILDGCRSGGLTNVKGGEQAEEFEVRAVATPDVEGLVMISSSAAGEDSHESERLQASFFSHHFNNALIGAGDQNADGRVTLSEAYAYAYRHTLRSSGRTSSLQHPTYAYDLKGKGELVMTELSNAPRKTGYLELEEASVYLVLDGGRDGEVVAELETKQRTRLALPPGEYFVQRRTLNYYFEYQVVLAPGSLRALETFPSRKIGYAQLVRKGSEARALAHGLYAMSFGRGQVLDGQNLGLGAYLAYGLDLEYVSLGARTRMSLASANAAHLELGLGLSAQHFFDLDWVSLGLGVVAEVVHHRQRLDRVDEPNRSSTGVAFGVLLALQRTLHGPLVLRLEGGPMTYIFKTAVVQGGAQTEEEVKSGVTGWLAVGLGWMF